MGQSNGRRNMWVVDGLASNNNGDIVIDNTMAYGAPYAITEGNQIVYRDWVLNQIAIGVNPVRVPYSAGVSLPIVLASFQTLYSAFGSLPKITCRKVTVNLDGSKTYQDLTESATINITEITDQIPDSISINVDDDGTGHLADNLQIIISK